MDKTEFKRIKNILEYFPVFKDVKPLKVGIIDDLIGHKHIVKRELSEAQLRLFMVRYVAMITYLKNCIAYKVRFDLDGEPCGEVTPSQIGHAEYMLKVRKRNKRKAFEEQKKQKLENIAKKKAEAEEKRKAEAEVAKPKLTLSVKSKDKPVKVVVKKRKTLERG